MTEDLIIIIPTHNRQHYLRRVIKYYSSFPCKVYICDSTPEVFIFEEELPSNIEYISCPDKNFYQKVYSVIKNTEVPFYALSPDDDFIKLETLKECYEVLKNNENYSFATGKQICFNKPFDNKFVNIDVANLLSYHSSYFFALILPNFLQRLHQDCFPLQFQIFAWLFQT